MATIELSRQEIWTILCWVGDPAEDNIIHNYNSEEASVVRKLKAALPEEEQRFRERAAAPKSRKPPE